MAGPPSPRKPFYRKPMTKFSLLLALSVAGSARSLPVSFENREPGRFLARFAGGLASIYPDRIVFDGVTLRFRAAAASARLESVGDPSPASYLRGENSATFPQY